MPTKFILGGRGRYFSIISSIITASTSANNQTASLKRRSASIIIINRVYQYQREKKKNVSQEAKSNRHFEAMPSRKKAVSFAINSSQRQHSPHYTRISVNARYGGRRNSISVVFAKGKFRGR